MSETLIISANDHLDDIRTLFQEYINVEYTGKRGVSLSFQNVDAELENLPGEYIEPSGGLFLIYWLGNLAGCVAFRKLDQTSCEIKRLYIRESFRGHKLGQKILLHLLSEAKNCKYRYAYCDTLSSMTEAITLYRKLGFSDAEPYYNNPLAGARYFKKNLQEV